MIFTLKEWNNTTAILSKYNKIYVYKKNKDWNQLSQNKTDIHNSNIFYN